MKSSIQQVRLNFTGIFEKRTPTIEAQYFFKS